MKKGLSFKSMFPAPVKLTYEQKAELIAAALNAIKIIMGTDLYEGTKAEFVESIGRYIETIKKYSR